jgi:hypothetical protein
MDVLPVQRVEGHYHGQWPRSCPGNSLEMSQLSRVEAKEQEENHANLGKIIQHSDERVAVLGETSCTILMYFIARKLPTVRTSTRVACVAPSRSL